MIKVIWWVAWMVVWWHVLPAWLFWLGCGATVYKWTGVINRGC